MLWCLILAWAWAAPVYTGVPEVDARWAVGDMHGALALVEAAERADPEALEPVLQRARLLSEIGLERRAAAAWETAAERLPPEAASDLRSEVLAWRTLSRARMGQPWRASLEDATAASQAASTRARLRLAWAKGLARNADGDIDGALETLEEACTQASEVLDETDPVRFDTCFWFYNLHRSRADFHLGLGGLVELYKAPQPEDPRRVLRLRGTVADGLTTVGQYEDAQGLLDESEAWAAERGLQGHPIRIRLLCTRVYLHQMLVRGMLGGDEPPDFDVSNPALPGEEALALAMETVGWEHMMVLDTVRQLAKAYFLTDRPAEATRVLERALVGSEDVLRPDAQSRVRLASMLAELRSIRGDTRGARALVDELLAYDGLSTRLRLDLLSTKAKVAYGERRWPELVEATEAMLALEGMPPMTRAGMHSMRAAAAVYTRDPETVLAQVELALEAVHTGGGMPLMPPNEILESACIDQSVAFAELGDPARGAAQMDEHCAGISVSRDTEWAYFRSWIAELHGDVEGALQHARDSHRVSADAPWSLDGIPIADAVSQLVKYRRGLDRYVWLESDAQAAWAEVLTFKGLLTRRTRSRRLADDVAVEDAALLAELTAVKAEQTRALLGEAPEEVTKPLAERRRALETELAARGADFEPPPAATPAEICGRLQRGETLVDYFAVQPLERDPAQYLAFVVTPAPCTVRRVTLGPAADLDVEAEQWRASLANPDTSPARDQLVGAALAEKIWAPLGVQTRKVWVVPDGALASIPFAALPAPEGLVLESHTVSFLSRAEALRAAPAVPLDSVVAVGGVDFGTPVDEAGEDCLALALDPLPGTASEVETLASSWRRGPVALLTGEQATEQAVAAALGASVAHVATHGVFNVGCGAQSVTARLDPLALSSLAMAGANARSAALDGDDGLLSAGEIALLDLSDTALVVLSACDTGRGEAHSGHGVLGLRHAFAIAGVRSLMMTLWAVGDESTEALMGEFYRQLQRRRPPAEALRRAQLTVLQGQRAAGQVEPAMWAAFVTDGTAM